MSKSSNQTSMPKDEDLILAAERQALAWQAWLANEAASVNASVDTAMPNISGYQIIEELHRGGQGVVYLAVQEPTGDQVAIKIMRDGRFSSQRSKDRFEREMQILAQLDDPRIVRLRARGDQEEQAYFVTDFIPGRSLMHYIVANDSTREKLTVFQKVCEAVHAAHVQGVIHRDLKPSNIQVDDVGEPHILDFGLAKSEYVDVDGSQKSTTGGFVGSLAWASPEQAEGLTAQVDTRSDIYSLGVILFQLVTGQFPYSVTRTFREVLDNIVSAVPRRPSSFRADIHPDLDYVVLKCLAKDRDERYQSAGELARDIGRLLAGVPIQIQQKGAVARLGELIVRNRRRVLVGTSVAMLAIALTVTLWTTQARARAADRTTKAILASLEGMSLAGVEKQSTALGNLVRQADAQLSGFPELHASVLFSIATTHFHQDRFPEAERLYARALQLRQTVFSIPHEKIAESLSYLASAQQKLEKWDKAKANYMSALAMRRAIYSPTDRRVAQTLNNVATCLRDEGAFAEAAKLFVEALAIFDQTGNDLRDSDVAKVLGSLGHCELESRQCEHARKHLEDAYRRKMELDGQANSDAGDKDSLANTHFQLARLALECAPCDLGAAEKFAIEALEHRRTAQAATHFHAESLVLMARIRQIQGNSIDAVSYLRACVEVGAHIQGKHRDIVREAVVSLIKIYEDLGETRLAAHYREIYGDYSLPVNQTQQMVKHP